jgi:hypothetical protein
LPDPSRSSSVSPPLFLVLCIGISHYHLIFHISSFCLSACTDAYILVCQRGG